jgi:hypothetical protein
LARSSLSKIATNFFYIRADTPGDYLMISTVKSLFMRRGRSKGEMSRRKRQSDKGIERLLTGLLNQQADRNSCFKGSDTWQVGNILIVLLIMGSFLNAGVGYAC